MSVFCGSDSRVADGTLFTIDSVPLCFVYPAMLHLKAVAKTKRQILVDWVMIIFGTGAAVFTTVQTIKVRYPSHPSIPTGQSLMTFS